jgi:serine-type D-Ala-D-Ala carboxypeptidase (penicillin-binding protein 5/6)
MRERSVLEEGRLRRRVRDARARRARRRRRMRIGGLTALGGAAVLVAFLVAGASGPASTPPPRHAAHAVRTIAASARAHHGRTGYGADLAPVSERVNPRLQLPVRSGLLFDVRTGRVLWERDPRLIAPIASLTKMMTALVVVEHARANARVLVTRAAVHYSGSGIGLLPQGKYVLLETMLYGLLLPSGNDAAIALAQHVAGTEGRFIAMMNARARSMGLSCTHFTTDSGIVDQGNHSCATDLAIIAHAVLERPLLARIVSSRSAVLPFPIKGGKLYLYNNNPLLRLEFPGTDGVKTGYTNAAGRCLVATARRGASWLGVVLLHSQDPPDQARTLLSAGFAALGAAHA